MSDIKDGGSAFPSEQGHTPENEWNQTYDPGMSIRDYFAGQALAGMLAHSRNNGGYKPRGALHWHNSIAEEAYEIAYAMLNERST